MKGDIAMTLSNLRQVLAFDAASCGLVFAACVLAGATVAGLTGLPPGVVAAGGWICLAAGLLFALLAVSRTIARPLLVLGVAGNMLWVAASLAVVAVFAGGLTGLGMAIVLGQAVAVAALTWLEVKGIAVVSARAVAA
jgi:hypothetical protein